MIRTILATAATSLTLSVVGAAAWAQTANRAWVSGHGADAAGCGAPSAPCRSLQYTHDHIVAAGDEIDIRDPAGYGAITITKAISIVNDGVGTAGVQTSSGNAITISAGANDAVTLRGLNIDGLGQGSDGIVFNAGASLTVVNCVVRHFLYAGTGFVTGNGILIQPTAGSMSFLISNVIATDNGFFGVYFRPPSGTPSATGVIDHVIAASDQYGIGVVTGFASGGVATVAVTDSVASNNSQVGMFIANAGAVTVSIDDSTVSGNGSDGIFAEFSPKVLLGRSVITSNLGNGVTNDTSGNTFYTYGNNSINLNGVDVPNPLNTTFKPQ